MSPAAPRRTMPGQRNLLEAAPAPLAPPRKGGRSRNEIIVLLTVIGLFVLAGGLALAIAMGNGDSEADKRQNAVVPTSEAAPQETEPTDEVVEPTETTRPANQPAGPTKKPTPSRTPSKSPSPSVSTSTSPTPTETSSPPTTEPTNTTTPTDPATDPTDPEEGGGGDGGGGTEEG